MHTLLFAFVPSVSLPKKSSSFQACIPDCLPLYDLFHCRKSLPSFQVTSDAFRFTHLNRMTSKLCFIMYLYLTTQKSSNINHNVSAQLGMDLRTFEKQKATNKQTRNDHEVTFNRIITNMVCNLKCLFRTMDK